MLPPPFDLKEVSSMFKKIPKLKHSAHYEHVRNSDNDPKIGRNDKCPCGSGKKHKHCCIDK